MKTHILHTKLFVNQPWHGVSNILKQTNRQEYCSLYVRQCYSNHSRFITTSTNYREISFSLVVRAMSYNSRVLGLNIIRDISFFGDTVSSTVAIVNSQKFSFPFKNCYAVQYYKICLSMLIETAMLFNTIRYVCQYYKICWSIL